MRNVETVWEFNTAKFCVKLQIEPEEMDPADSFQFDEDIEAVRNGSVEWFCASVVVELDGREIGRDSLGGCAYTTVREFYEAHRDSDAMNRNCSVMRAVKGNNVLMCHYFPDMVRIAISEARKTLAKRAHENLVKSLDCYVSGDDAGLSRSEFLTVVADRITDDVAVSRATGGSK